MPNGGSKNWIRFCAAIDGFRCRYGKWPRLVRVPTFFSDELKIVLSEQDQSVLSTKIRIIGDGSPFIAMDESGNSYDYGEEGFSDERPDIQADVWLDVTCEYDD